ncbi:hypothetical protein BDV95DRAFT_631161 [Massariosphaeria phaeospora]|uniref:non-specific serine/threonine protein kinase n=1 Tax=Massariosphaeria phaeospora TaxID=100035 RepID=A0A7C8M4E6_9PLEO|nr:hypothetical protein BDV95DRAFT_631161 [Massariosphaeria phaeospora]
MPAKQVYGKRAVAKPSATYSKFLSPDKDEFLVGEAGPKVKPSQNEGHEKRQKEKKTSEPNNAIEEIEAELGALTLGGGHGVDDKEVVRHKEEATKKDCASNGIDTQTKKHSPSKPTGQSQGRITTQHVGGQSAATTTPVRTAKPRPPKTERPEAPPPNMHFPPTPDATPEPLDIYSAYAAPLLPLSDWNKLVSFDEWSDAIDEHFEITKIAEASFSEVYRLSATSAKKGTREESVLKVVALKTPPRNTRESKDLKIQAEKERAQREENDQWKSQVQDVYSELRLLQNLNDIPGFTHFRDLTILQGRPSTSFTHAWKAWNKTRPRGKKSEFPDPSKKASYEDTQLWAIIEMEDAGTDCEKVMDAGGMGTIWEVWDVFWGVCLSVAKAEAACRFEHRDLHLENICIRSSRAGGGVIEPTIKDPLRRKLGFSGLETTVIDYTLSRADIVQRPSASPSSPSLFCGPASTSALSSNTPDVVYLDLDKDPALFEGDAAHEYQYEIYRYMRTAANISAQPLHQQPTQSTTPRRSPRKPQPQPQYQSPPQAPSPLRRSPRKSTHHPASAPPPSTWSLFHPRTNLVWLHFVLAKLLDHLSGYEPAALSTRAVMANVVGVHAADAAKVHKRAVKLHRVLQRVAAALEPDVLLGNGEGEALGSATEVVVWAVERAWLGVGDVEGGT